MSAEKGLHLDPKQQINVGDKTLNVSEEDATSFNLWIDTGANLPFRYFELKDETGATHSVHANRIKKILENENQEENSK